MPLLGLGDLGCGGISVEMGRVGERAGADAKGWASVGWSSAGLCGDGCAVDWGLLRGWVGRRCCIVTAAAAVVVVVIAIVIVVVGVEERGGGAERRGRGVKERAGWRKGVRGRRIGIVIVVGKNVIFLIGRDG